MNFKRIMVPPYCAPTAKPHNGSCLTLAYLKLIARLWNSNRPVGAEPIRISSTKEVLVSELRRVTKRQEHELSKLPFVPHSASVKIEQSFRPKSPVSWTKNPNEWLRTDDIEAVMTQYENRYPTFKFMGVFPIDFATRSKNGSCVEESMCRLDVAKLAATNVKRIGVVFNLDKHFQKGSHWVGCFVGIDPKRKNFGAFYFDSVSSPPPPEVRQLTTRIRSQINSIFPLKVAQRFRVAYNVLRRQFRGSECGMFSMYFLIKMLEDTHRFEDVCKSMGNDLEMSAYRDVFYRPS